MLPYREGAQIPAEYREEVSYDHGLLWGGGTFLTLSYGVSAFVGARNGFDNGTGWMLVPGVGPWVAMLNRDDPCRDVDMTDPDALLGRECEKRLVKEARNLILLLLDGLIQTASATVLVIGATSPERQWVRADVAGIQITPMLTTNGDLTLRATGYF